MKRRVTALIRREIATCEDHLNEEEAAARLLKRVRPMISVPQVKMESQASIPRKDDNEGDLAN